VAEKRETVSDEHAPAIATADDIRPPIPMTCAARPTVGGLTVPYVNVRLADGGVDFRARHQAKYAKCWQDSLCQVCGHAITERAVLLAGPSQLAERHADEPPLCVPCALYTTRACPMVAGRQERFADRGRVSEGNRGKACAEPGCDCGGWTHVDPSEDEPLAGKPAHAWYAVYVRPGSWQVTASVVRSQCSDRGCWHERPVINGGLLAGDPLKVVLVSSPGEGRVWRTLTADEVAELIPQATAASPRALEPAKRKRRLPRDAGQMTVKQLDRSIDDLAARRRELKTLLAELAENTEGGPS
jgi:hypothetical protein